MLSHPLHGQHHKVRTQIQLTCLPLQSSMHGIVRLPLRCIRARKVAPSLSTDITLTTQRNHSSLAMCTAKIQGLGDFITRLRALHVENGVTSRKSTAAVKVVPNSTPTDVAPLAELCNDLLVLGSTCRLDNTAKAIWSSSAGTDAAVDVTADTVKANAMLIVETTHAIKNETAKSSVAGASTAGNTQTLIDFWGLAACYSTAAHFLQVKYAAQWKAKFAPTNDAILLWLLQCMQIPPSTAGSNRMVAYSAEDDGFVAFFRMCTRAAMSNKEVKSLIPAVVNCALKQVDAQANAVPLLRGCYIASQHTDSITDAAREEIAHRMRGSFENLSQITDNVLYGNTQSRAELPAVSRAVIDVFSHGLRACAAEGTTSMDTVERSYRALLSSFPSSLMHVNVLRDGLADVEEVLQCLAQTTSTLGHLQLITPEFYMIMESLLGKYTSRMCALRPHPPVAQRIAKALVHMWDGAVRSLSGSVTLYTCIQHAFAKEATTLIRALDDASIARCISLMATSGVCLSNTANLMLQELNKRKVRPELLINVLSSLVALRKAHLFTPVLAPWMKVCHDYFVSQPHVDPAFTSQLFFVNAASALSGIPKLQSATGKRCIATEYRNLLQSTLHSSQHAKQQDHLEVHKQAAEAIQTWSQRVNFGVFEREFITDGGLSLDFACAARKCGIEIQGLPHFIPKQPAAQVAELAHLVQQMMPDKSHIPIARARTHIARSGRSSFSQKGISRGNTILSFQETEQQRDFAVRAHRAILSSQMTPRTQLKLDLLRAEGWNVCAIPLIPDTTTNNWPSFVDQHLTQHFQLT